MTRFRLIPCALWLTLCLLWALTDLTPPPLEFVDVKPVRKERVSA